MILSFEIRKVGSAHRRWRTELVSLSDVMRIALYLTLTALLIIVSSPSVGLAQPVDTTGLPPYAAAGSRYMVAADHPLASAAGARILAEGGNAFDAAVAVSFAAGVVRPYSTGLGGGGFALLKTPGRAPIAIDFRECAPASCTADRYRNTDGSPIPDKTVYGSWAVGVPGTLKGAAYILGHFGTMTLPEVIQPALELAANGFPVDAHTHEAMTTLAKKMRENDGFPDRFAELYRTFLIDGEPYAVGDTLRRPSLAETLRRIADTGPDALYSPEGFLHRALVEQMGQIEGPLSSADLTDYELVTREPLRGRFGEYETWTMPPPSSGGAVVSAVLNAVERFDRVAPDPERADALWPHFLVECFKHSFADRANGLGDWDFDTTGQIHRAIERMIDTSSASWIVGDFDSARTYEPDHYGTVSVPVDDGTCHFCVIDAEGNAVAWTETINQEFGSYAMIPGTGVILNNELDDFAVTADVANMFGLVQSESNLIGPGKRPLSSMSPTIVSRDGWPVMLIGGSGGPRIITGALHVLLNILHFGLRADHAVAAPRFHHQWQPDVVRVEPELDSAIIIQLARRGHRIEEYPTSPGIIQVIDCRDTTLIGVSDPRKGGRPAGR